MKLTEKDFIIGVTGHRVLPGDNIPEIKRSVNEFYREIKTANRERSITVLSPLAEGADILCARIALDHGMRLVAPLPMPVQEYLKGFFDSGDFYRLSSTADEVFVVEPEESVPAHPETGFYYRQAGLYVAKSCDILLAVWDGIERSSPDGAGTWETIRSARQYGKKIHQILI